MTRVLIKTTAELHWIDDASDLGDLGKAAGFWWHYGKCASGCPACRAGVPFDRWWTTHPEALAQLVVLAGADRPVRFDSEATRICVGGIIAADRRRQGRRTGSGAGQVEMRSREPGEDDDD